MRRLIIRPGAIGDFIVSLPALESLRADYTEVWTTSVNLPLVKFANKVDSIFATGLDVFGLPGRPENQKLYDRLRGFDSIVSWYGAGRPEFREYVHSLRLPIDFYKALPAEGWNLHAVDYYLAQVGARTGGVPSLPVRRRRGDYVAIHPFSGSLKKNWPLSMFRQLAAKLAPPVCFVAGPDEPMADAHRFDDLWSLAEWLAGARLYIGNDSGISHLAAAVGVPVVSIFGPTSSNMWAPRGHQVQIVSSPDGNVESVTLEAVSIAVHSMECRLAEAIA